MNKKALSESDICDKFIRPAMERAGWDGMVQLYREFPLRAGRVVVRGRHWLLGSQPAQLAPVPPRLQLGRDLRHAL